MLLQDTGSTRLQASLEVDSTYLIRLKSRLTRKWYNVICPIRKPLMRVIGLMLDSCSGDVLSEKKYAVIGKMSLKMFCLLCQFEKVFSAESYKEQKKRSGTAEDVVTVCVLWSITVLKVNCCQHVVAYFQFSVNLTEDQLKMLAVTLQSCLMQSAAVG